MTNENFFESESVVNCLQFISTGNCTKMAMLPILCITGKQNSLQMSEFRCVIHELKYMYLKSQQEKTVN